ncbi:MAG: NAD-dependent epimerase/dehydratase family protein [Pseudolysinimonas sp.]
MHRDSPHRIAITGGTGFVGRHLAERYPADRVVAVSRRTGVDVDDVDALARAFEGCDVVAHFAGINREIGDQTYERVHVRGTEAVIAASRRAGVRKIILLSFLRARPGTGSGYHESKWAAEELVRQSGLDFTILKAGMIYGHGDHLVDHLSHVVQTMPFFATVGLREKTIRPVPVGELIDVVVAAAEGRMPRQTIAVVGAETLTMTKAVRRVAAVVGRPVIVIPAPVWALQLLGRVTELTMHVPLVAVAQVRMLAEGVSTPAPPTGSPPHDLRPRLPFDREQITASLPPAGGFTLRDLRLPRRAGR